MKGLLLKLTRRTFRPRSLRSQLLARSLFILAALLLLIGILQYWIMQDFLYRNQAKTMQDQMLSLPRIWVGSMERGGTMPFPGQPDNDKDKTKDSGGSRPYLFLPDRSLAVYEKDGTYIDISGENGLISPKLSDDEYSRLNQEVNDRNKVQYRIVADANGTEQLVVFGKIGPPERSSSHLIQMGTPTTPIRDLILRQLVTFGILSLLAMLGGLALNVPVLRRTLVPLSNMVDQVKQIDAGSLAERLPVSQGQQEVDRLALSFNGMLERLEAAFEAERESKEQMKRFVSDASHELRTPLTSIHGFIEVLQRGAAANAEQLSAALKSMHGESLRINKLVEDLLLLTKLDQAPQLHMEDVRLDSLVRDMQPQLEMLAQQREVQIDVTAELHVRADVHKIKQVLLNLFHNAVQHTDPVQGRIVLSLYAVRGAAELSVKDNGTGIELEHLSHIFERFYRTASSRSRKQGGAGLGLAITKSIVESHGGDIRVDSLVGQGTRFTISLPLLKS
ncbi:HAMP domain-containing sensor histidine kinase [Paenibacillus sp. JX-17]|uniref:histidine kinase n=1 Tax=Paenibacillus lacisoli TaxID=3064525 RepID=A0ABT9C8R9_9BACL|nr:HAMP domain-containing sensor histidine kinase [Paenibacillus sp. JX-17]MDO7905647.1 HAMP domain-containing sensor histidine kinase [Paenibacillus sp. JX-17]